MAKMERPAWTLCLIFIYILAIPGIFLTHLALGDLIPAIGDLPNNLVKGFDEVFKFAYLEADTQNVKAASKDAVFKCGVTADAQTPNGCSFYKNANQQSVQTALAALPNSQQNKDFTAEKQTIVTAFDNSLTVINRIANDKYLGTEEFKTVGDNLRQIQADVQNIQASMQCAAAVPVFCNVYESTDGVLSGVQSVRKGINEFKDSDAIKTWEERKGMFVFMHLIPYIFYLGLLCFTVFWWRGGVCCCCRGGTIAGLCMIPYYILMWIVEIFYAIVMIVGMIFVGASEDVKVDSMKGKPSLRDLLDHIQNYYPEFWDLVLAPMEEGCLKLYHASFFFNFLFIVAGFYVCCEMICCPYRKPADYSPDK